MSKKSLWLDRSLFDSPYYYCLCVNERDFKKQLKYLKLPKKHWPDFLASKTANATIHFFENKDKLCAIVCIAVDGQTIEQVYALLVHEAVHLFQEIKAVRGEHEPSIEFEAYAIQALSQNLMESYKEQTRKK